MAASSGDLVRESDSGVSVRVPGDKSLTQRALILAALCDGESRLSGLLHGGDAESTAGALRALGVGIPKLPVDGSEISVRGVGLGGLRPAGDGLDFGNSGTGARLLLGALAGSGISTRLVGDPSLQARPMTRVTDPLTRMGASFVFLGQAGRLPIEITGRRPLRSLDWPSPVASAQVKSAILLAGLTGGAPVSITEPRQSRDHTERMLKGLGVSVDSRMTEAGWRVEMLTPPEKTSAFDFAVPGDLSSAAFVFALAALSRDSSRAVTVEGVGLNPTRTAFLDVLKRMGARVEVSMRASRSGTVSGTVGEPVGDVTVSCSGLRGTSVSGMEIPRLIDELPLVAVLGARAEGVTRISGAAELRAKESDRIEALVSNLRGLGVEVEEFEDGLEVKGTDRPLSGFVSSYGDHRITMSFGVLGYSDSCDIEVGDPETADVSFPGFWGVVDQVVATQS